MHWAHIKQGVLHRLLPLCLLAVEDEKFPLPMSSPCSSLCLPPCLLFAISHNLWKAIEQPNQQRGWTNTDMQYLSTFEPQDLFRITVAASVNVAHILLNLFSRPSSPFCAGKDNIFQGISCASFHTKTIRRSADDLMLEADDQKKKKKSLKGPDYEKWLFLCWKACFSVFEVTNKSNKSDATQPCYLVLGNLSFKIYHCDITDPHHSRIIRAFHLKLDPTTHYAAFAVSLNCVGISTDAHPAEERSVWLQPAEIGCNDLGAH